MNKQQAETILMKLIGDLSMKHQDYLTLEKAITVLKQPESPAVSVLQPAPVLIKENPTQKGKDQ